MLLLNLLLTAVWVLLTEDTTFGNIIAGFLIAFAILSFSQRVVVIHPTHRSTSSHYFWRAVRTIIFIFYFLEELVAASINVLLCILQPHRIRPAITAVPLDLHTDFQIMILANVITLTPGTLCLDISQDKKVMYIHSISVKDSADFSRQIKQGFERRILDIVEA